MIQKMRTIHLSTGIFFGVCGAELSAQYDATALRSPLAVEEHFQTSLGRVGHRFEAAPINKFRLYDFYARQAAYHLGQGAAKAPDFLLPYPGLQGGRQGHWGNTNEPRYSAVTDRTEEPGYHRLMIRSGGHFISFNPGANRPEKALCVFDAAGLNLNRVVIDAVQYTPLHNFSYLVDRFGFNMAERGRGYLVNKGAEWADATGRPLSITNRGYYVHGEDVIYRRNLSAGDYLEMSQLDYIGDTPVFRRVFEWGCTSPPSVFRLPQPGAEFKEEGAALEFSEKGGSARAIIKGAKFSVIHEVRGAAGAKFVGQGEGLTVEFPGSRAGDRWQVSSWVAPVGAADGVAPPGGIAKLSDRLRGGGSYFAQAAMAKGGVDADPAAAGSGYALDDIPVPVKNPYGVPMTTSGLAFDADGVAYISTLVGDIWRVTGLDGELGAVTWKRFASGISLPLGLEMVDGVLYVLGEGGITRLHDYNLDGEADYYERFTKMVVQLGGPGSGNQNLERDAAGNFYVCGCAGVIKISPDGEKMEVVSAGARNSLGLGLRPDGLALSDSSEGSPNNGTCTIYESNHPENEGSVSHLKRILYLPRGVDNSPGSRTFMNDPRFGPLGKCIIGTSYGSGRLYHILRDPNHGTPQAAMMLLPMEVSSGAARVAINPKDGQVYVVGFDGWGDFAVEEGSFNRIRYTGEPCLKPVAWKAYKNGISVTFNTSIDPSSISADGLFLQQWNYIDSPGSYGSGEYSVKSPDQLGHDRVGIDSVHLSDDGKELFVEAQALLPAMSTQLYSKLKATNGAALALNLFATLNQLNGDHPRGAAYSGGKPLDLVVPTKPGNGNTYSNLTNFFDKRAGRDLVKRPVAAAVPYKAGDLSFEWLNQHLFQKQCMPCHGPGMPHNYTTYDRLMKYVNLEVPEKSFLLGMIQSESMPPFPMPTVAPEMKAAVLQWIREGAPESAAARDSRMPLSAGKTVNVSGEWIGREKELSKNHIVDGSFSTIWAAAENSRSGWVEIDLGEELEVASVILDDRPYMRARKFALQVKEAGVWKTLASGTTIGARKRPQFEVITARYFRLNIESATDVPTVSEFQLYAPKK
jgi:hypothetical protein